MNTLTKYRKKTPLYISGEEIWEENTTKLIRSFTGQSDLLLLLAKDKEKIVGQALLYNIAKERKCGTHKCSFKLSVDKDYRGIGLGELLLEHLIKFASKHYKLIEITCFGNNEPALKLYAKHGFQEYGRLPYGYLDTKSEQHLDRVHLYKIIP